MIFTNTEDGEEYAVAMGDDSSSEIFLTFFNQQDKKLKMIKLTKDEAYALSVYIGFASIESSLRSKGLPPRKLYHEQESQPS